MEVVSLNKLSVKHIKPKTDQINRFKLAAIILHF